jgi:hypothetical protein
MAVQLGIIDDRSQELHGQNARAVLFALTVAGELLRS